MQKRAALAAHPSIVQDLLGVKHVYIQHHHCQGCEGDPCCEWKDLWPDHSPDVVGELYRLITLSSRQEQKSGEQSKHQWTITSCIAKVMNSAMFDQQQHDRMSFIWYLVRMILFGNFLQCTTAHFITMHCTVCCNKNCSCNFFFFFEKLPKSTVLIFICVSNCQHVLAGPNNVTIG